MRLDRLLGGVDVVQTVGDAAAVEVRSVTHDSRRVAPGALFCCLPGATADGHDFAPAALAAGASALLVERVLPVDGVQVVVGAGRARRAMALVAAAFHGHPSGRLTVAGVTGTNGKTTVAQLLAAVFEAHGWPTLVVGTLSGARTTPEAPDLQAALAAHADAGGRAAAVEVSSHALDQHRVDGSRFAVAVFTNLSHEHLDYHGTMEAYFGAKARLFTPELSVAGVVNGDDPWGRRLVETATVPVTTFGLADASDLEVGLTGSTFRWRGAAVRLRLGGEHNVANALAAATAAEALDLPVDSIAAGLGSVERVPGRLEPVAEGQPFAVLVDYAHTPDGLARVLAAARRGAEGHRVAVVFGCGGDRDQAKRPEMGRVATDLADLAVLTSDNPRSEDPDAIIEAVRAGVARTGALRVEPDRRRAIAAAIEWARPGDVVVVAGKGHEQGQESAGRVEPFDDRVVASELLRSLGASA
ncbi:MAG TPA: UDP-N-acetylmuramoyl-L-alanyl-D-glutamate--2,6-diaminopimelate ligase [Acidimicrobiales bacterium]|nr:UDP-N-acetylmuramoyl-L-alanyl-D-glutamate--2,6-diaminopimelate ligase [Acidimicrobiales bacterium]